MVSPTRQKSVLGSDCTRTKRIPPHACLSLPQPEHELPLGLSRQSVDKAEKDPHHALHEKERGVADRLRAQFSKARGGLRCVARLTAIAACLLALFWERAGFVCNTLQTDPHKRPPVLSPALPPPIRNAQHRAPDTHNRATTAGRSSCTTSLTPRPCKPSSPQR